MASGRPVVSKGNSLLEFGGDDFVDDQVITFSRSKKNVVADTAPASVAAGAGDGGGGYAGGKEKKVKNSAAAPRQSQSQQAGYSVALVDSKGRPLKMTSVDSGAAPQGVPLEALVTKSNGGGPQATHCAGCSSPFSFSKSKHLCRSCNSYFCSKCSPHKKLIPSQGDVPVRVCDVCFHADTRRDRICTVSSTSYFTDPQTLHRKERHAAAMEALNRVYKAKIKPIEQAFKFSSFYASELTDGDFDSRPMILLVGQYSVGKTSFIKYLLERDFPGQRIGPEPTTDRFLAITNGPVERVVPGNAAAVDPNRPFSSLTKFGTAFLNRFEVSEMPSPILDNVTMVDTPGILSGEKQRVERGYEFEDVVQWFAERSDRILILFDAHKLDISDELKRTIEVLKPHEDKIRIVLNKADLVGPQQLMRIYGALMWSLGKVVRSPEVLRVYIGSFWDEPLNEKGALNSTLFEAEKQDLLSDLRALPRNAAVRKVNELIKRARLAKVHALLINHLRAKMPMLWGSKEKQKKLAGRLEEEYLKVQREHNLALGDFPNPEKFRAGLSVHNLSDFPKLSNRQMDVMEGGLSKDIPKIMMELQESSDAIDDFETDMIGSVRLEDKSNPFAATLDYASREAWVVDSNSKAKWDNLFYSLSPTGNPKVLSGTQARGVMLNSGLASDTLRKIWDLSDIDQDGVLDADEFALAMHLISMARNMGGASVPDELPLSHIPPSKRS
ncbi:EH domain-containing protein 1 [Porphyridium purpureum]|uniref:EH domain-containing protein 1 n=1 Tax=Porphyridium purpureum TaxID=35688 RepID=A0A5J4YHZ7_PORPP|nr:EH domain-containing protein 1 [Porphyridium purpureum]|eukprot:POR8740..scf251_18